jgi:hypothetical protein
MELRKILFSLPEVRSAAIAHCRATGRYLPDADIARVTIGEDVHGTVILHFRPSMNPADPAAVPLNRADVTEALIQLCVKLGIPLPRSGRKVLWPQEDSISLMVTLNQDVEVQPGSEDLGPKKRTPSGP